MYSYEEFKELVTERLKELVKKDYPDIAVHQSTIPMDNQLMDVLVFTKAYEEMGVAPSLYLHKLYGDYVRQGDFEYIMQQCSLQLRDNLKLTADVIETLKDQSSLANRITFELIHTEQNKEFLKQAPHREFLDLSVVYNCYFKSEKIEGHARVTDTLAELLGVTEEELYVLAYENTKRVHKPIVKPLGDVVLYMMAKDHEGIDLEEIPEWNQTSKFNIYMLTNRERERGAASLLYPEELVKLAEKLDSDLYIVPASVDEVLVVETGGYNPEELAQTVYEMNKLIREVEDRLSNQVYFYNRQTQEISLATDTEHTMLTEDHEAELDENIGMGMGG